MMEVRIARWLSSRGENLRAFGGCDSPSPSVPPPHSGIFGLLLAIGDEDLGDEGSDCSDERQ
ncbi:hypothetical protein COCNU_02G005340 [Cocos nucifera]|uniref:Uncharacterized protein n=1 Tax=Cocos nucifera TaxID=13894 RepID=A0A8K0HYE2_COCNU|nr:hypothetical protein COCNU_02G005340 [Cocos nucifera]